LNLINLDDKKISRAPPSPNIDGLQNYWPINGDMRDYIGQSDMSVGVNAELGPDRFDNPQSALYLNNGYCTVPPGVYFNGSPFTITAWVKEVQFGYVSRLLDFGNGYDIDNIVLTISAHTTLCPFMLTFNAGTNDPSIYASSCLSLGEWTHLAAVFDGSNGLVYLNGTPGASQSSASPQNVLRQNCFIGRSNWLSWGDQDADAYFDDIKIYNRALSADEIRRDMNN
jgi:hypothetical protein